VIARRARDDESGTTVIELVIASGIFLIMLVAVLNVLDTGTKQERAQQARHSAMLQLRNSMTRMTKDIRQVISIAPSSSQTRLDTQTYLSGAQHHVVYQITSTELTRTIDGGAATPMATRVVAGTAFCYDPPACALTNPPAEPTTVRITVAVVPEAFSRGPITLATEVELRNVTS
jgi:type II secretory pathway pseudopilin PulG